MTLISVAGMIGVGKTSVTDLLAKELGYKAFHEEVDGNEILPLFYTASPEEQEAKRYPFLLQLEFLSSRFSSIKEALKMKETILDRSIYEDWYFARINTDIGNISETEFRIYEKLLNNMMEELEELPKKAPDLMLYLRADFDTILERIGMRGRAFEQDPELYNYYQKLWSGYDDWVSNWYDKSDVLIIDMDKLDVVNNPDQAAELVLRVSTWLTQKGYVLEKELV